MESNAFKIIYTKVVKEVKNDQTEVKERIKTFLWYMCCKELIVYIASQVSSIILIFKGDEGIQFEMLG